jgi:hypothetical protein
MQSSRWHLRYQFSLRTMLAATTLVALGLGYVAREHQKERNAAAAVTTIRNAGGRVAFRGGQHGRPSWLTPLLGDDRHQRVDEVNGGLSQIADAELALLAQFPRARRLKLWDTRVTDLGLRHLQSLSRLEVLDLAETSVTDAGLAEVCHLRRLKRLDLLKTAVSDASVPVLCQLPELE